MTEQEYAKLPGLRSSDLKASWRASMAKARYESQKPETPQNLSAQIDPLRFGTAFHALALEPDKFPETCIVLPQYGRSKADLQAKRDFLAENEGKIFLRESESEHLHAMQGALFANKEYLELTEGCEVEGLITWEEAGQACKMRYDLAHSGESFVVDLKTAQSCAPEDFQRSAYNYGYHIQAGFYAMGFEAEHGTSPRFYFAVIEKSPPHDVAIYEASEAFLSAGMDQARVEIEKWKKCLASDVWPGHSGISMLELPKWAK